MKEEEEVTLLAVAGEKHELASRVDRVEEN